ncbi:MAG: T9SS type A sorting domain-containing protein [Salinivirgaceae bacterium]|nr:T9SS type A sorting domain-containing protein [Salinivirgaceae bacterium]
MKQKLLHAISLFIFVGYSLLAQAQTTIPDVPYWYQYSNQNNPGGTCQITAMASVLEAYGATGITPDKIYSRRNYSDAKEPYGWASMFNSEAQLYGLSVRASGTKFGSPSAMRAKLDEYKPVVVFGYFTSGGHIVTTLGYTSSEYICHDPAGVWSEIYKGGGYTGYNPFGGEYVSYGRANYEYAVGTPAPDFWMVSFTESLGEADAYCTSRGENTNGEWIESIGFGGYNIESGNNNGYHKNLNFNISVTQGESYQLALKPGFNSNTYSEYWKIYADLNQDEDFNDEGELLYYNNGASTVNGSLTIPANAYTGATRIRFIMKGDSYTADACARFTYGEVEDYQLYIEEGNASSETITLNHPGTASINQPVTFSGNVSSGISTVKLYTGQWLLGTANVSNGTYSVVYSFNSAGNNRELKAIGYNSFGAQVASKTSHINIVDGVASSITLNHPDQAYVGQTTNFNGAVSSDIQMVKLYVDTYYIGESTISNGHYSIDYAFNSSASNRQVDAKGYNSTGTQLASATSTIDVLQSTSTYNLTINHESNATVGSPVTFSGSATGGIQNVVVSVDGFQIANVNVSNGTYSFAYTFNGVGTNRSVVANAFVNGQSVKQITSSLSISETGSGSDWGEAFADDLLANSVAYENQGWSDINNQGTPCVAFLAVGLRNHPTDNFPGAYCTVTEGPASESCSVQFDCTLEQLGFNGPYYNLSGLKRGDIVFTDRVVAFQGQYWSSHAMVFDHWQNSGSTSYAYFIDYHNERGLPYLRNASVSGTYDKALFYYRYNSNKATVSSDDLMISEIEIYPNPANSFVHINTPDESSVTLFNSTGQLEINGNSTGNSHELNLEALPNGIYFVKICTATNTVTKRIIKQ